MTDYIKKAAKLAGWLDDDDEGEYVEIPNSPVSMYLDEMDAPYFQFIKDALAAQLVRQVDALTGCLELVVFDGESNTMDQANSVGCAQGQDRTMNTIKAIVDSGVLND